MSTSPSDGRFPDTRWTLVQRIKSTDGSIASRALNDLCAQYHYPLYCCIRHRGLDHHDAQDALHDFLAQLLRRDAFEKADTEKGSLRAWLSACLRNFLINWQRDRPHRRREVSSDADAVLAEAEGRFAKEHFTDEDTPDRIFDRQWADTLFRRVLQLTGDDYAKHGKGELFRVLKPVLQRGGSLRGHDPAALAAELGLNEGALRTALSRLVSDFREILRHEIRQTVAEDKDVEVEMAHLRTLFAGK